MLLGGGAAEWEKEKTQEGKETWCPGSGFSLIPRWRGESWGVTCGREVRPWGEEAGFCGPAQGEGGPPGHLPLGHGQPSAGVSDSEPPARPRVGGDGAPAPGDLTVPTAPAAPRLSPRSLSLPAFSGFFCVDCLLSIPHWAARSGERGTRSLTQHVASSGARSAVGARAACWRDTGP